MLIRIRPRYRLTVVLPMEGYFVVYYVLDGIQDFETRRLKRGPNSAKYARYSMLLRAGRCGRMG